MPARTQYFLLALVTALGFAINLGTALKFDDAGLLADDDMVFNADCETYKREFVWGGGDFDRGWGGRTYKHPNLTNFVNPPVRAAAAVLWKAGLWTDYREARHAVALCISPLAGMLTTVALFFVLRGLMLGPAIALLICLVDAVCFARVVHGSLPESFALAGLATALLLWLTVRQRRSDEPPSFLVWLAAGVFAVGITISNLLPLVLLHFRAQGSGSVRRRALATAGLTAAAILVTVALAVPMAIAYGAATEAAATGSIAYRVGRGIDEDLRHYHGFDGDHLALFPLAVLTSFTPPQPAIVLDLPHAAADMSVTYLPRAGQLWPVGLLALPAFGLLVYAARRVKPAWPVASACAAVLAAYWVVHLFYGDELFLYALHWQAPLLVLLAVAAAGALRRRTVVAALALLVVIAAALSGQVVSRMLRQWEAMQVGSASAPISSSATGSNQPF